MKIAYFDCFSGASGDMIIGSLLDAGLDFDQLKACLSRLPIRGYELNFEKVTRGHISCTKFHVLEIERQHEHRNLGTITKIIKAAELELSIQDKALDVFNQLAQAEAAVHGKAIDQIHFHEVGAIDSIIDIVGAVAALYYLDVETISCSPLNLGRGTVRCAHGILPVPAPATAFLVKEKPVYSNEFQGELLTPTGAAILTTLASSFGALPEIQVSAVGHGAGQSEREHPNFLRVFLGDIDIRRVDRVDEEIAVIQTNIDDMNPQIFDYLIERLLKNGAMDVFLQPIQMKKNRPGVLLTVLCKLGEVAEFTELIMKETTTIGIRWHIDNRIKADRKLELIETELGTMQIKIARFRNKTVNVSPEYEDCKRFALEKGIPLKTVIDCAKLAANKLEKDRL